MQVKLLGEAAADEQVVSALGRVVEVVDKVLWDVRRGVCADIEPAVAPKDVALLLVGVDLDRRRGVLLGDLDGVRPPRVLERVHEEVRVVADVEVARARRERDEDAAERPKDVVLGRQDDDQDVRAAADARVQRPRAQPVLARLVQ